MQNKQMLDVLNYILDELEASTNPSLVPLRLHELKMKLHTFVHDVSLEMAQELDPLQNQFGTPAQANANESPRRGNQPGGLEAAADSPDATPATTEQPDGENGGESSDSPDSEEEPASKTTTAVSKPSHRKPLFDRKKK